MIPFAIDEQTGCWLWAGARDSSGYSCVVIDGHTVGAHRAMFRLHRGPIPKGTELDHRCRVRHCVNPEHLEPVTRAENTQRGHTAKLTAAQVVEIRERYAAGGVSQRELGAEYGVDQTCISLITRGASWRHPIRSLPETEADHTKECAA